MFLFLIICAAILLIVSAIFGPEVAIALAAIGVIYIVYLIVSAIFTAFPFLIVIIANIVALIFGIIISVGIGVYTGSVEKGQKSFLIMTVIAVVLNCLYLK